MLKRLMNIMFLSCLKATGLIEKKLLFRLSFGERIRLAIHKMMCDACTLYEKQAIVLDKVLSGHPGKEQAPADLDKFTRDLIEKFEEPDKKDKKL